MRNTEERLSDIETVLRMLVLEREKQKQSRIRQLWNWVKSHASPMMLGVLVGFLAVAICSLPFAVRTAPPVVEQKTTLEQQAAAGGAAIPFPSEFPSPSLWNSPQENSTTESTASSLTNTSEPPLPSNPQADSGQQGDRRETAETPASTRLFRRLTRPTR